MNELKNAEASKAYKVKTETEEAQRIAEALKDKTVRITAKAGQGGRLFGSVTGTTDTRVGLVVNQTQTNTLDISASSAVIQTIGLGLFTIVVPVVVLVIGLVIFLRRRHL